MRPMLTGAIQSLSIVGGFVIGGFIFAKVARPPPVSFSVEIMPRMADDHCERSADPFMCYLHDDATGDDWADDDWPEPPPLDCLDQCDTDARCEEQWERCGKQEI